MWRISFLLLFISKVIYAYEDADLDGVEDAYDQCSYTPLTELVDSSGCTIQSLVSYHHYDIIVGGSFSQLDYRTNELTDTYNTELQFDYYYKSFSLQAVVSYFNSNSETYSNRGLNDSYITLNYQWALSQQFQFRLGAGVIIPTYDSGLGNEALDVSVSADFTYTAGGFTLLGRYGYTLINDTDIEEVVYQNTHALNAGVGVNLSEHFYSSLSYYRSDSIYVDVEALQSISLYSFYSFDLHWFGIANYAYGLSDSTSNHYLSLKVGYYF
ncbi:MAG: DUF3187 domain-containing protein [Epsilonproteobacteria bacterium]|nr:MAG: DUF3187 domain-containing protein [Campylobacterota bacterium]